MDKTTKNVLIGIGLYLLAKKTGVLESVGIGAMPTKVKPKSMYAEWITLNKFFGNKLMSAYFNNYIGYEKTRKGGTSYQDVYDELIIL
jgi:hypothetical protein